MKDAILDRASRLGHPRDLLPVIERVKDARVVMLGEASHGTHEFYEWRRLISEWLIARHDFRFIAVEGDWPPCQALHRYVQDGQGNDARSVLGAFNRWPTWMWANTEVIRLGEWLRSHNARQAGRRRVGFHGLDVYSLFESIDRVLESVERVDPRMARLARAHYGCFGEFGRDEKRYARSLLSFPEGCRHEALATLKDVLKLRADADFDTRQNARIVANAENYYRTMVHGSEDSWNVRDRHMVDTLEHLLELYGTDAKCIVWAHNTHIGVYRATDMARHGQVNLGGLARERYGDGEVALVGFGTYRGSVIASPAWDGPVMTLNVPPGRPGSIEESMHLAVTERGWPGATLVFEPGDLRGELAREVGHRAIGVVYQPRLERLGNYVPTSLSNRYDAFVFIDETRALDPLIQPFDRREFPDTYPAAQ